MASASWAGKGLLETRVSNLLRPTADFLHLHLWVFKWTVDLGTLEAACMAMTCSWVFSMDPPGSGGQWVLLSDYASSQHRPRSFGHRSSVT